MYIAINKSNPNEYHSFTWTQDDKLIINGQEVDVNDWDIVGVDVEVINLLNQEKSKQNVEA